uniref:uncharacterized protein LOC100175150 isoform X2 n=1 Tax=Ciona intestinalis TaxID=7719 RepID=UPI00006A4B77|nr:uncharacterized protein LOC100175150 isoform X2 [Ciona intestinalis]|eukprot:XP_018666767.1 uncharacterized protein LOC100175150 isoform X2 [Ciona intestinalis]
MIASSFENVPPIPTSPPPPPPTSPPPTSPPPASPSPDPIKPSKGMLDQRTFKRIVALISIFITLIGIALVIVACTIDPDDFDESRVAFDGDIQLEEDDDGFIQWDDAYSDPDSDKSRKLEHKLSRKIKAALDEEGFMVDRVEIKSLSKAAPRMINRNEEIKNVTDKKFGTANAKYANKKYNGISFVKVKYVVFGKPSKNAATFQSAKYKSWWKMRGRLRTRLANNGLRATVKRLDRSPSFSWAIKRGMRRHYKFTTIPPPKQEAVPCTCKENLFKELNPMNPSKVCQCQSACIEDETTVYGGKDDIFAIFTPLCASAYYAGIISDTGGIVEVLYTGRQEVMPGNKTVAGFTSSKVDFIPKTITLKALGSLIIPTEPPPPLSYEGSGFAPITTTENPFLKTTTSMMSQAALAVQADDDDDDFASIPKLLKKYNNEPIVFHLHIKEIDKRKMQYNKIIFSARKHHILEDFGRKLNPMVKAKLVEMGFQGITVDFVQFHRVGEELGFAGGFAISGNIATLAKTIKKLETTESNGGSPWRALETIGKVINKRYSKALLETLQRQDG